jgi:peptidoglycan LD-endopeptidase CwlK
VQYMPNQINRDRISKLHPAVIPHALHWLQSVEAEGINILVTQTLRTIQEQDALYAQGRTMPGLIVTQVKGGYSFHNYGLALDFCLLDDSGRMCWDVNSNWYKVAQIGKDCGFSWGGDWRGFLDYPHLEMTFGLIIADLRAGKKPPEVIEMDPAKGKFIESVLKKYYDEMAAYPDIQAYTHECAIEVRRVAGIPEE